MVKQSIPTPRYLKEETTADEVRAMVFRVVSCEKTIFVGLGNGEVRGELSQSLVWFTPIAYATLEVLLLLEGVPGAVSLGRICHPVELQHIINVSAHMSKIMILGEMTDNLQNGLLRELNVIG
jgi:hypothetical protein